MAVFPAGIASLSNPASSDKMNIVSHATQHTNANNEIMAIETALGVNMANIPAKCTGAEIVTGTNDTKFATPKALADAGIVPSVFGAWVDKSASYAAQQATTDGLVVATMMTATNPCTLYGYTDSNASPVTRRATSGFSGGVTMDLGITMPVKKGDYWKVVVTGSYGALAVYWLPLGA